MKHILLNLKRFDIPVEKGGVNRIASFSSWAREIIEKTQDVLYTYKGKNIEFVMFFPETHLLSASNVKKLDSNIEIGCQGVYRRDTEKGGDFGAFTTQLTANAAKEAGCSYTLIGHCEERKDKMELIEKGGGTSITVINQILNEEIKTACAAGLKIVYCIGESEDEKEQFKEVLKEQLTVGLNGVDKSKVVIAYEPIWAIGPGKTPPGAEYITMVADYIKEITEGMDVVYGGGLKRDNAAMLAEISSIDGGLIALTRFEGEIGFYPEEYLEIIRTYYEK